MNTCSIPDFKHTELQSAKQYQHYESYNNKEDYKQNNKKKHYATPKGRKTTKRQNKTGTPDRFSTIHTERLSRKLDHITM